ncbi:MAG: helix-turn-helix domain-containing protein, partial [Bosea sp. (in: a-proteobacteria)]
GDGVIQRANSAFLDMAGLGNAASAIGQGLDRWLGRAGVDFGVLRASMRDGGIVRNFATIMRSAYGATDSVEISAVGGLSDAADHLGFIIRPAGRMAQRPATPSALPRSAEEFKQLVGRVPLKELVRETSDIIEKLCIEAALELTGDNRASAAEMLGVSRQGLYAKMHRFGIGDLSRED